MAEEKHESLKAKAAERAEKTQEKAKKANLLKAELDGLLKVRSSTYCVSVWDVVLRDQFLLLFMTPCV